MAFKKIDAKDLDINVFRAFADGWGLVTAGAPEKWNTMTIAWGSLGWIWNRPVCTAYVRLSRYTHAFCEDRGTFSVCIFDEKDYRKELGILGKESGRDIDKMSGCGLTPFELDGEMVFKEARTILICKTIFKNTYDQTIEKGVLDQHYATRDFHTAYTAEITGVYVR